MYPYHVRRENIPAPDSFPIYGKVTFGPPLPTNIKYPKPQKTNIYANVFHAIQHTIPGQSVSVYRKGVSINKYHSWHSDVVIACSAYRTNCRVKGIPMRLAFERVTGQWEHGEYTRIWRLA